MVEKVLIEQQWMFNKIQQKGKEKFIYIKKDRMIVQSFNRRSFSKCYHVISTVNDV